MDFFKPGKKTIAVEHSAPETLEPAPPQTQLKTYFLKANVDQLLLNTLRITFLISKLFVKLKSN